MMTALKILIFFVALAGIREAVVSMHLKFAKYSGPQPPLEFREQPKNYWDSISGRIATLTGFAGFFFGMALISMLGWDSLSSPDILTLILFITGFAFHTWAEFDTGIWAEEQQWVDYLEGQYKLMEKTD
ncbi:MAG: hypothetical protein HY695_04955 [Deltaproteobacteria bacterium]|nr:hypothetical protein [Deltaproteobacteria bacterium]